jgi:CheY-like chemotaxis protein
MNQPVALVIDDEPEVARVTRYLLRRSGFDACAAHSAEEGVTLAQENPPDLIICDVALPGASGVDLLHRLKTDPATAHIPVILMSGAARFECAGMFTFLLKPFDSVTLVSAARNALADCRSSKGNPASPA